MYATMMLLAVTVILFAFTVSNAYCPGDMPQTSQQRTQVQTVGKLSLTDVARTEIVRSITTGLTNKNAEFENVLKNMLIWNISGRISDNDLALFISALIARRENPRHQNGVDMVGDLLRRVENASRPRPYLVLTLCNSNAIKHKHLEELVKYSTQRTNYTHLRDLEFNALVLTALACAVTLPDAHNRKLDRFADCMQMKAENVRSSMFGYLGNIYSTSLAVKALTAYNQIDPDFQWNQKEALESLRKESNTGSILKMYYLTIALNAHRVPFLKDLHKQSYDTQMTVKRDIHVTLSLQNEGSGTDFALQLQIPSTWTLLQVMFKASNFSSRFQFKYLEYQGFSLLEVDDTPNDPERGLYWRIFKEPSESLDPTKHIPDDGDNITLEYGSLDCV